MAWTGSRLRDNGSSATSMPHQKCGVTALLLNIATCETNVTTKILNGAQLNCTSIIASCKDNCVFLSEKDEVHKENELIPPIIVAELSVIYHGSENPLALPLL